MMHTGALFLMSDEQPMSRSCLYLHTYHITVFLITVLVTLLSITVSSARRTDASYSTNITWR